MVVNSDEAMDCFRANVALGTLPVDNHRACGDAHKEYRLFLF